MENPNVSLFLPSLEILDLIQPAFTYSFCHMFHIIGKMRGKHTLEGAWFGDKKEKNWENSPYLLCWTMISIETTRIKELCLWSKELQFRRHRLRSSQKKNSREENWTYKGNARLLKLFCNFKVASCLALVVKNPPASARDFRDAGSIPGSGRSPAGGHGKPLQYSCLGKSHGQRSLVSYRL